MRFCQMILNGGELDGARILGAKSVELMSMDHLHDATVPKSGVTLGEGCGFGLGYRVLLDPSRAHRLGSPGTLSWGGMASTMFFIDPREKLIGIVMTQKFPTDLRLREEFKAAVYQSLTKVED